MVTLIRAANLWGFHDQVYRLGADPDVLLKRFHIKPATLADPDAYVVYRDMLRLLETCAAELRCPDFGQRLSYAQGLEMLGPIAVIARNAETVLDAFASIARYLHIHCPALHLTLSGRTTSGGYRFRYHIDEPGMSRLSQAYELSLANGARIVELLAGKDANMQRICFPHAQLSDASTYRRTFSCPVIFEQQVCSFDISANLAQKKISDADSQTWHMAERYLESAYGSGEVAISKQVRELIRLLLPTGQCSIDNIAAKLALHPRSLQRQLAKEKSRYNALVDEERRERARYYLAETQLYLIQITGLLGYNEQSSLNRACRRWFGMTPRAFRQQHQNELLDRVE